MHDLLDPDLAQCQRQQDSILKPLDDHGLQSKRAQQYQTQDTGLTC